MLVKPDCFDTLSKYQVDYLNDTSKFLVVEKGRQVGLTFTEALKAICLAIEKKISTIYICSNEAGSIKFIAEDVAYWVEKMEIVGAAVGKPILSKKTGKTTTKVTFANGATITGATHNPLNVRGRSGLVVRVTLDEACFYSSLANMRKAALGIRTGKGQLTIISTHTSVSSEFNQLILDINKGLQPGKIITIPFMGAVSQGLYHRFCERLGEKWTQADQDDWVAMLYAEFRGFSAAELDCQPQQSGDQFFTLTQLLKCQSSDVQIIRRNFDDSFGQLPPGTQSQLINDWFNECILPYLSRIPYAKSIAGTYLGVDIGRVSDLTSLVVLADDRTNGRRLITTPLILEIRNLPYDCQAELIKLVVDALPSFRSGAIDSSGIGAQIGESVNQHNHKVDAVKSSQPFHDLNWVKLARLLDSERLQLPIDVDIERDFQLVQYIKGFPKMGETRFKGSDDFLRHGDTCSAYEFAISCLDLDEALPIERLPNSSMRVGRDGTLVQMQRAQASRAKYRV